MFRLASALPIGGSATKMSRIIGDYSSGNSAIWDPPLVRLDECRDFPFLISEIPEVSSLETLECDVSFLALIIF